MKRQDSTCEVTAQCQQAPPTLVTFRKGHIKVSDPAEFHNGKVCGQAAIIDGGEPIAQGDLFRLFADGVQDSELSESWLVGFFLGMADALLRGRKLAPLEMRRPEMSLG